MNATAKQQSLSKQSDLEMLHTERNIEIAYDRENGLLHCNWIGFQNKESIMKSGEKILECLMRKKVNKVLNDNTLVTGPWHEAAEWTVTNWFPRMEKAGLQHFAWIFSNNIFAELSAKKAMPSSKVVRSFADIKPAKDWLTSLN
jgi:hypothetical protein